MTNYNNIFGNNNPLNENETKVLEACIKVSTHYGEGPYYCVDEVSVDGLTRNQIKGYIAQLTNKGYVGQYPRGEYYFDSYLELTYDNWEKTFC